MLHQLIPAYVDTGKAKIVFRYFAFIGPESNLAAEAAECASEQKKFWEYGSYVYAHQAGENNGAFNRSTLKSFASAVGVDMTAFNACFDNGKYADLVNRETQEGRQRGVSATPTFFVNGMKYEGLMSASQFGQMITTLGR